MDAHLAEMKIIASQYRSGAKSRKRLFVSIPVNTRKQHICFLLQKFATKTEYRLRFVKRKVIIVLKNCNERELSLQTSATI